MAQQERVVLPNQIAVSADDALHRFQQFPHRQRLADRVVAARVHLARHAHDPFGEVANVDELSQALGPARREDVAAARHARRPVGKAIRRIIGTDDQSRTDDRGADRVNLIDDFLARDLQRAVSPAGHRLRRFLQGREHLAVLVFPSPPILVHRHRRDEEITADLVLQEFGGSAHLPGQPAVDVDRRVEDPIFQPSDLGRPVAEHPLAVGE